MAFSSMWLGAPMVIRPVWRCDVVTSTWEVLSEDILYQKRRQFRFQDLVLTETQSQIYCLLLLEDILNRNGKSLADYTTMPIPDATLLIKADNRLIQEQMNYNINDLHLQHQILHASLNVKQLLIYERVVSSVLDHNGGFYFVYGAGCTGKTYIYQAITARLRSGKHSVLAVASSGIDALLLPNGRTTHSRCVIPLEILENSMCGIKQNTHLAGLLNETKLIIWDEVPMTQRYAFEALDRTLRDICRSKEEANKNKLFGGITVLLGGDFRQILPVIPKGRRQDIVEASINNSHMWPDCQVLTLSKSMRVNELDSDGNINLRRKKFNEWVMNIGDKEEVAKSQEREDEATWIEVPKQFILDAKQCPIHEIVREIFPDFTSKQSDAEFLRDRSILTPLNEDADAINEFMFDMLHGDMEM